ncbi:hypothetical protein B7463_g11182, partial [Scytalidium lignicola]
MTSFTVLLLWLATLLGALLSQPAQGATTTAAGSGSDSEAGLDACFSDDSICPAWTNMNEVCENELGAPQNYTQWSICLCESGWLEVLQACYECQNAYSMSHVDDLSMYSSDCTSSGFSIAPIPSSLRSVATAWDTFTTTSHLTGHAKTTTKPASTRRISSTASSTTSLNFLLGLPTSAYTLTLNGEPTAPIPSVQIAPSTTRVPSAATRGTNVDTNVYIFVAVACFASFA